MPSTLPPEVVAARRLVGTRLRALREDAELTQERLGEVANVDRKTINRIEGWLISPTVDQLALIAGALGVHISALFDATHDEF